MVLAGAAQARADVVAPIVIHVSPGLLWLLWLLVPIIGIEALRAKQVLGISPGKALLVSTVANFVSVLAVPLAWLLAPGIKVWARFGLVYGSWLSVVAFLVLLYPLQVLIEGCFVGVQYVDGVRARSEEAAA
jgi:hypothetical protein